MSARERDIEKKLVERLRKLGVVTKKLSQHGFRGSAGWPDQLVIVPGPWLYFVELKRDGEVPTKRQQHVHDVLRHCGCAVDVVTGMEEAMMWVDELQSLHRL